MNKAIAALAAVAALGAIPATASATQPQTWCPQGGYPVWFAATQTSCRTAMRVKRYWDSHEIVKSTARIAGRTWRIRSESTGPIRVGT
jgi:hypothetical protein